MLIHRSGVRADRRMPSRILGPTLMSIEDSWGAFSAAWEVLSAQLWVYHLKLFAFSIAGGQIKL